MTDEQKVLMMGILSIVCCGILGPIAWVRSNTLLREIDEEGYEDSERNLVIAGQICAKIGTAATIFGILDMLLTKALSGPN